MSLPPNSPRRLGIASHIGLLIDRPTIGVAKSRLTGSEGVLQEKAGSIAPLLDGTEEIGKLLRSKERSKPLYISIGNRITLDSAMQIVQASLRGYRLPEPTRLAHEHVNDVRRKSLQRPLL
jgi:deoxyribonuclease V